MKLSSHSLTSLYHVMYLIVVFMLLCQDVVVYSQLQCKDENNKPVDWYVLYKLPQLHGHKNKLISNGTAYMFITSNGSGDKWILSSRSINSSYSIPGRTLSALYRSYTRPKARKVLYMAYNDQPPKGEDLMYYGHTKGVVMADRTGGFWLIHSVPHYPSVTFSQYTYPATGLKNGQSYMCMSLPPDQMETVGLQLMYNNPRIFTSYMAEEIKSLYPNLTLAAGGKDIRKPPWESSHEVKTRDGISFKSFAKAAKFDKDLYAGWVAGVLRSDLLVETWPNGPGRLQSECHTTYTVKNVDEVKLSIVSDMFSSHKDHSKWAVSQMESDGWVCVGDINRAASQLHRGGGTACLRNKALWSAFYTSVGSIESCPREGFLKRIFRFFKKLFF